MTATKQDSSNGSLTQEQRVALAREASAMIRKAKTAEQIKTVWQTFYLRVGHRVLGRLLIGQTVEQAMRITKEK